MTSLLLAVHVGVDNNKILPDVLHCGDAVPPLLHFELEFVPFSVFLPPKLPYVRKTWQDQLLTLVTKLRI